MKDELNINLRLAKAVQVIETTERALEDLAKAARKDYLEDARNAVFDFMDQHRASLRNVGGQR